VTSGKKTENSVGETIKVVIHALLIALVIRTFLFQPFNIPSGSMKGTLLVGDYLFVSKFSYGYSRFSMPFSPPLFSGRIWGADPSRGDVVVFRFPKHDDDPCAKYADNDDRCPKHDNDDYIKRVIGLPGERIQMQRGVLYINDEPVKRERMDDFVGEDPCGPEGIRPVPIRKVPRWKETLPNGVSYETLQCDELGFYNNTNVYTVPPGHFFMMGDNRDNSSDSRVDPSRGGVGYVPKENLIGRAQVIFFSVLQGESAWRVWEWPWTVRWNRLFKIVR